MKKIGFIISLFIGISLSTLAIEQSAHYDSLYSLGNAAYQNQNYDTAILFYNQIVESGIESADLYFNLANANYKSQHNTEAILYYEKALKLQPNSPDIIYNLKIANGLIVDKIETLPTPFYQEWWNALINAMSFETWGILSISFMLFMVISLLLFLLSNNSMIKRVSFFVFLLFLSASTLTYFFARTQYAQNVTQKHAIVFSDRATIYSAPNTTSTTLFVIHNGLKVKILNSQDQWYNIVLPDGSVGWIAEENLIII